MSRLRPALLACTLAAATTLTSAAQACWDGRSASSDRVNVSMPGDDWFDIDDARGVAHWLARIESLLPAQGSVQAFGGFVTICSTDADCREVSFTQGRYAELFDVVVRTLDVEPATARTARTEHATPWTVQVFASRSRGPADAMALKIDEDWGLSHGYYVAGGFPAINPVAHVVRGKDAAGREIWRVLVGTYLSREEAAATDRVLRQHGISGFVRAL